MKLQLNTTSVRRTVTLSCFVSVILSATVLLACQVPVFRFALERWNPDPYRIQVLVSGSLNDDQRQLLDAFQDKHVRRCAQMSIIDVTKTTEPTVKALWKQHPNNGQPLLAAFYPESSSTPENQPASVMSLTKDGVSQLVMSPAREDVIRRLSAGQSAVWVLVRSGQKDKDTEALKTLEAQLAKDAEWLKLPSPEELEVKPSVLEDAKIPLQIQFSVVEVDRDDAQEQFLIDCLLNSEEDLRDYDEPLAFPVFGRGRVLYALVGQGISSDTIRAASSFIAGPCSCQVKSQNPGFDLILPHDWETTIGPTFISQPLPEEGRKPQLLTIPPGSRAK